MNAELLRRYIIGDASEQERKSVVEWIETSDDNMRIYMAERRLYEYTLLNEPLQETSCDMLHYKKRSWGRIVMRAVAVVIVAVATMYYWREHMQSTESILYQTVYVPFGQRAELLLPDSTRVWLNANTTLTYPTHFATKKREVYIDGEGYFQVTRDEQLPFIVKTNKYDIRVLGTEFNIFAYSTDSLWKVALLHGKVELLYPHNNKVVAQMKPGTQISLVNNKMYQSTIVNSDDYRWREGLICFDNITIAESLKNLKLYFEVDIEIRNKSSMLQRHYTGKFRVNDGVEHILKVLQLNNKFTYIKDTEENKITIY